MNQEYTEYLKTEKWKMIAGMVKERAGHRCQICNKGAELEAHHRTYVNLFNELEHMGDLTCLCRRCHGLYHESKQPRPKPAPQKPKFISPKKTRKIINCQYRPMPQFYGPEVVITRQMVKACRTPSGGFSGQTIRALGLTYPLPHKWTKKLVGVRISGEAYRAAFEGRLATIRSLQTSLQK
jgi:hypothetical protein